MSVTVTFPFPPSANSIWRTIRKGVTLSKAYRQWIEEAGLEIALQHPPQTLGRVRVVIEIALSDFRRRDIDNRIKPVMDLIVKHHLIQGDDHRYVQEVTARWINAGHPCTVTVESVP